MHKPHNAFGKEHIAALLLTAALVSTTPAIVSFADTSQATPAATVEQTVEATEQESHDACDGIAQDVAYTKRSWDGTQVCEQAKVQSNARPFPADGHLDSHCYVVDHDMTIDAPIQVFGDASLVVCDGCTLTANGGIDVSGTLDTYGDGGTIVTNGIANNVPGIGGTGSLAIHGGTIGATGGKLCPGIGAKPGMGKSAFRVMMYGGDVIANGGPCAAGIGGGEASTGGMVHIYGGKLKATGGKLAAGIGDGNSIDETVCDGRDDEIKIWGGEVEANGGEKAAGIGSGADGSFGTIAIHGGTVTANGGSNGSGIGGWREANNGNSTILIDGGDVTTNAGVCGDGIANSSNGTVSLLGGNVHALSCKGTSVTPANEDDTSSKRDSYGLAVNGTLEIGSQAHGSIDSLYADCGTLELGTTLCHGDKSSVEPGHYVFSDRFVDSLEDVEF